MLMQIAPYAAAALPPSRSQQNQAASNAAASTASARPAPAAAAPHSLQLQSADVTAASSAASAAPAAPSPRSLCLPMRQRHRSQRLRRHPQDRTASCSCSVAAPGSQPPHPAASRPTAARRDQLLQQPAAADRPRQLGEPHPQSPRRSFTLDSSTGRWRSRSPSASKPSPLAQPAPPLQRLCSRPAEDCQSPGQRLRDRRLDRPADGAAASHPQHVGAHIRGYGVKRPLMRIVSDSDWLVAFLVVALRPVR